GTGGRSRWPRTPSARRSPPVIMGPVIMGTATAGVTTAMSAAPVRSASTWSVPPRPDQMANREPAGERSPISWAIQPQIRCMFACPQSPRNDSVTGRSRRGSSATAEHRGELVGAEGEVELADRVEREADPLELLLNRGGAVGLVDRGDEAGSRVDVQLNEGRVDVLGDVRAIARDLFR